jgi:hypothetical protein
MITVEKKYLRISSVSLLMRDTEVRSMLDNSVTAKGVETYLATPAGEVQIPEKSCHADADPEFVFIIGYPREVADTLVRYGVPFTYAPE